MKYQAIIPSSCQAGVEKSVYAALAKNPQCARLGRECSKPCDAVDSDGKYHVELDHIVPRSEGGANSLDNLQWLCASENRRKYTKPDPRYSGALYFDSNIDIEKLRPHQQRLAYGKAVGEYKTLFESPQRVISRFMLLAWQVGAGKTIGMASVLFGINHVRKRLGNGSARRIKRVLWLVHQRSLVQALAKEIREDLTGYGIIDRPPEVREVEHAGHWGYIADVIVACPQALWDSENRSLDDQQRARILSEFDAVIVDEAQFAIDQYIDLCKLAPQAFKFAVTATPMNADGTMFHSIDGGLYRDWFALYSSFEYGEGYESGIYKELLPFDEGCAESVYMDESGGEAVIQVGGMTDSGSDTMEANNACRETALIEKARRIAKGLSDTSNFDHHVMVRTGSIPHAKNIVHGQKPFGDVVGVWSGSKGPMLGDDNHPWMLSKKNKGRIPKGGARIVVCIDIGQFGINQPYCSMIVWLDPNFSMIELVQRIGRALRRRPSQQPSRVRLMWNSIHQGMPDALRGAIDYILNMGDRLEGFVPVGLLSDTAPAEIIVSPADAAVKPIHRVQVASLVGGFMSEGMSEDEALNAAVERMSTENKWTEDYTRKVVDYGKALQTPEGRERALHLPGVRTPIRFVREEKSVLTYEPARLIDAIKTGLIHSEAGLEVADKIIRAIESGDAIHIDLATAYLRRVDDASRKIEELTFLDPKLIIGRSLSDDERATLKAMQFTPLATQLHQSVKGAATSYGAGVSACYRQLSNALNDLFGFEVKEEVYHQFRHALADTLMREHVQRLILARAKLLLIKKCGDVFPGLHERFKQEVDQDIDVLFNEVAVIE